MTATQSITAQLRQTNVAAGKNLAKNQYIGSVHEKKTSSSNCILIICNASDHGIVKRAVKAVLEFTTDIIEQILPLNRPHKLICTETNIYLG